MTLKRAKNGQFAKGNKGGPGRGPGPRGRLTELFVSDFLAAWEKHGKQALTKAAEQDPVAFSRIAATLVPKQAEIKHTVLAEIEQLTNEQLESRIRQLAGTDAVRAVIEGARRTH